jgi:hypothetical protein
MYVHDNFNSTHTGGSEKKAVKAENVNVLDIYTYFYKILRFVTFPCSSVRLTFNNAHTVSAAKYSSVTSVTLSSALLKGPNRIFRGFCINRFGLGPLHYISSRSDFGFEFAEIFVFEKRLPVSVSQGVYKIA